MGEGPSRVTIREGHGECEQCSLNVQAIPRMHSRFTIPSTQCHPWSSTSYRNFRVCKERSEIYDARGRLVDTSFRTAKKKFTSQARKNLDAIRNLINEICT